MFGVFIGAPSSGKPKQTIWNMKLAFTLAQKEVIPNTTNLIMSVSIALAKQLLCGKSIRKNMNCHYWRKKVIGSTHTKMIENSAQAIVIEHWDQLSRRCQCINNPEILWGNPLILGIAKHPDSVVTDWGEDILCSNIKLSKFRHRRFW